MNGSAAVFAGVAEWSCEKADCLSWLAALPDDGVDLLFTSPPYEDARTYGISQTLPAGQDWVDWMVRVFRAAAPKVKGLIAVNCEGRTEDFEYSGVPFLLFADLKRAGFNMRKPPVFHRFGIPGSGGPDWLRNDYEPIICVTREGSLPWSANTACGHPPKWAPGGEMSHRLTDGNKRNQWGGSEKSGGHNAKSGKTSFVRPSHKIVTKKMYSRNPDGQRDADKEYVPPAVANPGNVITCKVGGGQMGHDYAHENEAPFPLRLAEFFVRSFCPPGGVVADCFGGSGTVMHAAYQNGRRGVSCDTRQSQVELCRRRMATVTPFLV